MTLRPFARPAVSCALVMALYLAAATVAAVAQDSGHAPLTLNFARVSIAGTSNIHAYTASTTAVRLTRARLAGADSGESLWDGILEPGALEAFEIAIPAASLSSPKEGLDKNMHKALKVQEHADITFRLVRLEHRPESPKAPRVTGILRVAGVEREIAFDITAERTDSTLAVRGEVGLLMTDFGITPPKAMLGMLRTDPKVTVSFEAVLAHSLI